MTTPHAEKSNTSRGASDVLECGDLSPLSAIQTMESGDKSPHSKGDLSARLRFRFVWHSSRDCRRWFRQREHSSDRHPAA